MKIYLFIYLYQLVSVSLMLIAMRAGARSVWHAWVPVLRELMIIKIAGKRWWWIFLIFIPIVNIWAAWVLWGNVANKIGRSAWWGRLMIVPFFNIFCLFVMAFSLNPKRWPPIIFSWLKTVPGWIKKFLKKKQKPAA